MLLDLNPSKSGEFLRPLCQHFRQLPGIRNVQPDTAHIGFMYDVRVIHLRNHRIRQIQRCRIAAAGQIGVLRHRNAVQRQQTEAGIGVQICV